MIICITGSPASGKGTLAKALGQALGIANLSVGDLLRSEIERQTDLGKQIKDQVEKGDLVDNKIVMELIKQAIGQLEDRVVILDGFPRTIEQAKMLDEIEQDVLVVVLDLEDELIIERTVNRRVCSGCGTIYNLKFRPPVVDEICDFCGKTLVQREDDTEEKVFCRIQIWRKEKEALLSYYGNRAVELYAGVKPEELLEDVMEVIKIYCLEKDFVAFKNEFTQK